MSTVVWSPEMEVSLFYAMIDHKPVGENKHFHMIFIYEKFNNLSDKKLTIEQIWQHLGTLYDLQALDENEIVAFPNEETEFSLPEFETNSSNNSDDLESSVKSSSTAGKSESRKSTTQSSNRTSNIQNKSNQTKKNR